MFRKALLIAFCISLLSCDNSPTMPACSIDRDLNEYEVFSAVINRVYNNPVQPIVIFEKTRKNENDFKLEFEEEELKGIRKEFPGFDAALADDFNVNNEESYRLERKFQITSAYKFVSEHDFAEINSDYLNRFDKFAEKFPDNPKMIIFSKAGFDENLTQAVVFAELWNDRKTALYLKGENCRWKAVTDRTVSVH